MSKIPRDKLVQFVEGSQPDEQRRAVEAVLATDAATDRVLRDIEREQLFPRGLLKRMSALAAEPDPPVNPKLAAIVRHAVQQTANAELWCLDAGPGKPLAAQLATTGRIDLTVRRIVQDVEGSLPVEKTFPAVLEHVSGESTTYRLHCDALPAGYTVVGLKLSRIEYRRRESVETSVRIASLQEVIDRRPAPASQSDDVNLATVESRTLQALAADSRPEIVPADTGRDINECRGTDFHVQVNRANGDVFLKATMPLHRSHDHVVAELDYAAVDGNARTRRTTLPLSPSHSDRRWSQWTRWTVPDLDDHVSSEVTLRIRSLRDDDLYLLPPDHQRELLASEQSSLLVGKPTDGGLAFQARWGAQKQMVADPTVCWSVEVARAAEDNNDD